MENEADETAVSEEGSSSNLYSCEDGESNVSESEDEQSSEPERDYDDHVVVPLVQIVCTRFLAKARSRQLSTARRELARACFGVIAAQNREITLSSRDYMNCSTQVHSWNTGGEPELISVLHTDFSVYNYVAYLSSMQSTRSSSLQRTLIQAKATC